MFKKISLVTILLLITTIGTKLVGAYHSTHRDNAIVDHAIEYITDHIGYKAIPRVISIIEQKIFYLNPNKERLHRIFDQIKISLLIKYQQSDEEKFCVGDICIDPTSPYEEKSDILVQNNNNQEYDKEEIVTISKNRKKASREGSQPMISYTDYATTHINTVIVNKFMSSCGGSSIQQNIFDTKGKPISNPTIKTIFPQLPPSFKIGNITYTASLVFKAENDISGNNKILFDLDNKYHYDDDIGQILYKRAIDKNTRYLYQSYILQFQGYSHIYVQYTADIEQPLRIIYLGTDQNYINTYINEDNELLDTEVTNIILGYYQNGAIGIVQGDNWEKIESVTDKDIPVFKVQPIDNRGYYATYLTHNYTTKTFAEMCKPAVYIYSNTPQELTIRIDTDPFESFTHIIPDFNTTQGRTFQTTNNNDIIIDRKKFDYLYYALIVGDYHHNRLGRIVKGSKINQFFDDKLHKINFNEEEYNDFINYRNDKFQSDLYYFVSFKFNEEIDNLVTLQFSKNPGSQFRVLMDAYEIGDENNLNSHQYKDQYQGYSNTYDQDILRIFNRGKKALEIFERGGVLETEDNMITY